MEAKEQNNFFKTKFKGKCVEGKKVFRRVTGSADGCVGVGVGVGIGVGVGVGVGENLLFPGEFSLRNC